MSSLPLIQKGIVDLDKMFFDAYGDPVILR